MVGQCRLVGRRQRGDASRDTRRRHVRAAEKVNTTLLNLHPVRFPLALARGCSAGKPHNLFRTRTVHDDDNISERTLHPPERGGGVHRSGSGEFINKYSFNQRTIDTSELHSFAHVERSLIRIISVRIRGPAFVSASLDVDDVNTDPTPIEASLTFCNR